MKYVCLTNSQIVSMPYYEINGKPVFLSHQREAALNGLALAHKDTSFRVSSKIAGQPAAREADELRFQYLSELFKRDPEAFYREWVEFDIRDQEARDNAWDLLYDYCALYKIGELVDLRSEMGAVIADLAGDSHTYPMGRIFGLRVLGGHTVASFFRLRPRSVITLVIDTSQLVRACGILTTFRLEFRHCTFHCGKDFRVVLSAAARGQFNPTKEY
jgi:hypothetical protein